MNRLILAGGIEAAVLLAARGPALEIEPLLSRFPAWVRGDALLLRDQSPGDPIADLAAGVLQIPALVAAPLAGRDQSSGAVESAPDRPHEPFPALVIKPLDPVQVHSELDFGSNFVDVLPPGAGSSDGTHLQSIRGYDYIGPDNDRIRHVFWGTRVFTDSTD